MIPANKIRTLSRPWCLVLGCWSKDKGRRTDQGPRTKDQGPSTFRCLDELVHRLGIVKRLADRQARAHAAVEFALLEQFVVLPLRGDAAAVEHENPIGVAD